MEENEVKEVKTVSEVLSSLIADQTERYFNEQGVTKEAEMARNGYVKNIIMLSDKYKFLYETDAKRVMADNENETKVHVAELEQETRLKVAKLDADKDIKLADIKAQLESEISKINNETNLACCDAENQTKANIAEAELKQRQRELYLSIANIGINAAVKGATIGAAYALVNGAFIKEMQNEGVIFGRSVGTKIAQRFGEGVIGKLLMF